jgi:hypothetical protein
VVRIMQTGFMVCSYDVLRHHRTVITSVTTARS